MVNDARSHFFCGAREGTADIPEGYERGGLWRSRPNEVLSGSFARGLGARGRLGVGDRFLQLFEQGDLGGIDDPAGRSQGKPAAFIDLGEYLLPPRFAGPFNLKRITANGGGVEIAGECPGKDAFASLLPDGAQGLKMPFEGEAGLFAEFTDGSVEGRFFIFKFSFGYGPAAGVLVFPEGASGVD